MRIFLFLSIVFIFALWMMIPANYRLSGKALNRNKIFAESHIVFRSPEGKTYNAFTREDGSFDVTLPAGLYKIYRVEQRAKILSPTPLELNKNKKITVFFHN